MDEKIKWEATDRMKDDRQSAILEIIGSHDIETQEELAKLLLKRGFRVTQATISRDIKELHLIKIQAESGSYKYAVNEVNTALNTEKLLRVFKETVLDVQAAGSLVVVSTLSGSASAAAEVVDNLEIDGIIGSIAGDNTIFVAVQDAMVDVVVQKLKAISK